MLRRGTDKGQKVRNTKQRQTTTATNNTHPQHPQQTLKFCQKIHQDQPKQHPHHQKIKSISVATHTLYSSILPLDYIHLTVF